MTQTSTMTFPVRILGILLMIMLVTGNTIRAQTTLIAGWDFQTTTNGGVAIDSAPNTQKVFPANFGNGVLYLDGSNFSSSWSQTNELSSFTGTQLNAGIGSLVTSGHASLAVLNSTANGKSVIFKFSMLGFSNLVVSYATRNTSTGFKFQKWEYSSDGASWVLIDSIVGLTTTFAIKTLPVMTLLNNLPVVFLRTTFGGATAAAGNNRIDNIQFNADINPTASTDWFRSKQSGDWDDVATWQSSADSSFWHSAALIPTSAARGIQIRNADSVSITSDQSAKLVRIDSGGILSHSSGSILSITDTAGTDFSINGRYELNGTMPSLNTATVVVGSSGEVRVEGNTGGESDNFARSLQVFFKSGAVFNWNITTPFETSAGNNIYFPNAGIEKAIFRISKTIAFGVGSGDSTVINARLQLLNSITFSLNGKGMKIFRDGIDGYGNVSQNGNHTSWPYGMLQITSPTAVIGGDIYINLQQRDAVALEIPSGAIVTMSSSSALFATATADNKTVIHIAGKLIHNSTGPSSISNGGIIRVDGVLEGTGKFYANKGSVYVGQNGIINGLRLTRGGKNNYLQMLSIDSGGYVYLADSVNIAPGANPGTLHVNGLLDTKNLLTMRSDTAGTAIIDKSSTGASIVGEITVERFVGGRRSWRLMTFPTHGSQTINASLQEGVHTTNLTDSINPKKGYGMHITKLFSDTAKGYDRGPTQNASMYRLNLNTNDLDTIGSTNAVLSNYRTYFLFVRGDRSTKLQYATSAPLTKTILESKGTVRVGNDTVMYTAVKPGEYIDYGNPYVCPIRIDSIYHWVDTNLVDIHTFLVWDPKLAGTNGVGGYVTCSDGVIVPSSPTYGTNPDSVRTLQPNQGVMFKLKPGVTGATIVTKENAKTTLQFSGIFGRPVVEKKKALVRVDMYDVHNWIMDGAAIVFDGGASIPKAQLKSFGYIYLIRDGQSFSIERNRIGDTSSLAFKRIAKDAKYTLRVTKESIDADTVVVWDSLLHTETQVLDSGVEVAFIATDSSQWNNRFFIVTKKKIDPIVVTPPTGEDVPTQVYPTLLANGEEVIHFPPSDIRTIGLYDASGRKCVIQNVTKTSLNCSLVPSGIYFLKYGTKTARIVKTR